MLAIQLKSCDSRHYQKWLTSLKIKRILINTIIPVALFLKYFERRFLVISELEDIATFLLPIK